MGPTWFKLVLVVGLIVVLFGKGRISGMMGDLAKGIQSFKKGLRDDDRQPAVGQDAVDRLAG
jgi:sec-independent protein translocase protein TatA